MCISVYFKNALKPEHPSTLTASNRKHYLTQNGSPRSFKVIWRSRLVGCHRRRTWVHCWTTMSRHGLSDFPVRRFWSFQELVQNLPSERSPSLHQLYETSLPVDVVDANSLLSFKTLRNSSIPTRLPHVIYPQAPLNLCEHMALYKSWFDLIWSDLCHEKQLGDYTQT